MTNASFEKTNLPWQLRQWQQQSGEWLEAQLRSFDFSFDPDSGVDTGWLHFFQILAMGLLVIFLGLLIVGVLLGIWRLYQLVWFYWLCKQRSWLEGQSPRVLIAPTKKANQWCKQALLYQEQGNYREACRALYLAMLQQLDEKQLIAQQASRTDGEYDRLVQTLPHLQAYHTLLSTHERLCFSNSEISSQDFRACYQAYQDLGAIG